MVGGRDSMVGESVVVVVVVVVGGEARGVDVL